MTIIYRETYQKSRAPEPSPSFNQRREDFAREAALDAFGHRGRWALDEPDFQDHSPGQGTRHVGEVASEVVNDIGRWLAQADKAENDDARTAALEADAEIARGMGPELADLTGRRVA